MTVPSRRVLVAITVLGAVDAPTTSVDLNELVEPTPGPPPEDDADDCRSGRQHRHIRSSSAARGGPGTRVRIPTIEVDSGLVDLGLNDDRTLEVPQDFSHSDPA